MAVLILAATIYGILSFHSYRQIPLSPLENTDYTIQGVDVSAYQGTISWSKLEEQKIAFAFIKATEGSTYVDPKFRYNWNDIDKTAIHAGAYHFLSFDSSGKKQADHFIATVNKKTDMLPPVVDLELYGDYIPSPPSKEQVHRILSEYLATVEAEYGKKPIIYTTPALYRSYVSGFYDNPVWIADQSLTQPLSDDVSWVFCQYSFTGELEGYSGGVEHIDLNVFYGSKMDFYQFIKE